LGFGKRYGIFQQCSTGTADSCRSPCVGFLSFLLDFVRERMLLRNLFVPIEQTSFF